MASIFLNKKRSQYWIACFTVNGKQVQRSTRVTEKGLALAIATNYEQTGRQAQAGTLTEEQVRENINFILRLSGGDPLTIPTIRSWFNSWTKNAGASLSAGTSSR
jgi:hypothetical protein